MIKTGAFCFRLKEVDYIINDYINACPSVLGINFCSFLNRYNKEYLIKMVANFAIKKSSSFLKKNDKCNILDTIKEYAVMFEKYNVEDNWAKILLNNVSQMFDGKYDISWKVFINYLYGKENKFEHLMHLKFLNSEDIECKLLSNNDFYKWVYIANFDSKCLEIYMSGDLNIFEPKGRYSLPIFHISNNRISSLVLIDSIEFDKVDYFFNDIKNYFINLSLSQNNIKEVVNKFNLETSLKNIEFQKSINKI